MTKYNTEIKISATNMHYVLLQTEVAITNFFALLKPILLIDVDDW